MDPSPTESACTDTVDEILARVAAMDEEMTEVADLIDAKTEKHSKKYLVAPVTGLLGPTFTITEVPVVELSDGILDEMDCSDVISDKLKLEHAHLFDAMRTLDFTCEGYSDVRRIASELYPKAANYAMMGDTAGVRKAVLRIEGLAKALRDELRRAYALVQDAPDLRLVHEARVREANARINEVVTAGVSWATERWLLEDGVVPMAGVSASHSHPAPWLPEHSKLSSATGWFRNRDDMPCLDWIQVDAGTVMPFLGVRTRGRGDGAAEWVTDFQLSFSDDGVTWRSSMTLTGNVGTADVAEHRFPAAVCARFVRLQPLAFHEHACLRWDLLVLKAGLRGGDAALGR